MLIWLVKPVWCYWGQVFPPADGAPARVRAAPWGAEPGPSCTVRRGTHSRCFRLLDDEVRKKAPTHRTGLRRESWGADQTSSSSLQHIHAACQSRRESMKTDRWRSRDWAAEEIRRLSEATAWRGAGGDLWPLRILFWRILSDGRTVRMRMNEALWTERFPHEICLWNTGTLIVRRPV